MIGKPASTLVLLAGLWLVATPVTAVEIDFFDLGSKLKKAFSKVSTEDEVKMGGNLVAGLLGAAPLVEDEKLQRYVNDVGYWLASRSARPELPWSFGVIDSDGINAFAAPGGYVVITLGLYNLLENEAQLAGVLAHEIAHVVQKHHLQALKKVLKRQFWSGLAVSAVDSEGDRQKLDVLVNSGIQLYSTGLDRKYEYDADLRGVVLAARAGYDPFALLDVLTTIDSINPGAAELTVLLKTHPATGDRLDRLANAMDDRLDEYAGGQSNAGRFEQVSTVP